MNAKITARLVLLLCAASAVFFLVRGVVIGRSSASSAPSVSASNALLVALNERYPEPPPGQNAATEFTKGFEALQLSKPADIKLPAVGIPTPASLKVTYTSTILSNREALRHFAEGAKYQHCRYPIDLNAGIDLLLPHLAKLKNATLLLQITAVVHADARQPKLAANDVLTALALARSLDDEPPLLSQLTRAGSIALTVSALEHVLNRVALPAESLDQLNKQLTKMEAHQADGKGFDAALLMESASTLALFSTPMKLLDILAGSKMPEAQRASYSAHVREAAGLKQDRACYEDALDRVMAIRRQPFPARLQADALLEERVSDAANQKLLVADLLLRGLKGSASREAECLARLRLAKTAVAVEHFRLTHTNQYPTHLTQLNPDEMASDPFACAALRYAPNGHGYLLYSIGPDLRDDSGQRLDGHKGDLVFAVTRRP